MTVDRLQIVGSKTLPPDPSLVRSLGLHHSLTTAIADLVDNSIDARAKHVLIRLQQRGIRTVGLLVVDDGEGMDESKIDSAMTYAKKREYGDGDLGHFGLGLKAASLSQADTLVVWSRAYGSSAVGRLLDRTEIGRSHAVSVLSGDQAAHRLNDMEAGFATDTGTIVEWRDIYAFLSSDDPDDQASWLEQTINEIRAHLGIVLHRILAAGKLMITIQQYDVDVGVAGIPRTVESIDPFAYPSVSTPGYPKSLNIVLPGIEEPVAASAHIWPAGSQLASFRLYGRPGREHQGLYFYRNDRLLQIGGWNGVAYDKRDHELGRVAIDLRDDMQHLVKINPEKSGLVLMPQFEEALLKARFAIGDGGFAEYLSDLEVRCKQSRTRQRQPVTLVEPAFGLPGSVVEVIDETVRISEDAEPIEIRWRAMSQDRVFDLDLEARRLYINARMREVLVGHQSRNPDDAPVLKTMFYLLMSKIFESTWLGPSERQHLDAWQEILLAAVEEQRRVAELRRAAAEAARL
ncbi:ATP-binding protein [Rhodococcus sp. (in: high G+C Gram-positive bacteria)]|uniref:ATP-binding protein n=1 Tax=unclassified Rhodococcus (in: high G+C Gram-positive bacteria) TaxID=192944 RepID=UPI002580737E|nr:ATP-binding protein [Rhodococcus sp. (in: high G+C Gram-positive bacteria)]